MSLRTVFRAALAVLAVALLAGLGGFLWLRTRGLPQRSGDAALAGLTADVTVRFDRWGVPAVDAASARDLMAALGWLHANDRLFQMELGRRAAAGRLSELFGSRTLEFDERVRRLRLRRTAEQLVAGISPESRALLESYAAGVNAWLAARGRDLPPEFRLLRHRPEPWVPADSLGLIFMMARQLSAVFEPNEEEAFALLRAFGPARARELVGVPGATIFAELEALAREIPSPSQPLAGHAEAEGLGSNNWAVAPARSANGSALVANDPHLGLGLPGVWFQATLRAPDYEAAGMTIPGVPGVVLGRTANLAWAMTNLYVDDVDLFFERLDASGANVQRGAGWEPIRVETEIVRLDDGEEVEIEVRSTDRGPLLEADPARGLPARSLAWTGYAPADQLAAFLALARARSVDEVPAAIAPYVFPAQNLVVGDRGGRLLWVPIGRAPQRFGWDGRFPAPGWRTDVGWNSPRPSAENPSLLDPAAGLLATANSFLPVEQPAWFEGEFDTPFRARRIAEALAERHDWTPEALAALQGDTRSLWAAWLVPHLAGPWNGDAAKAWQALAGWDFTMRPQGPAALFALVERHLQRAVFEDEARQAGLPRFGTRWRLLRLFEGALSTEWFDDVSTPAPEAPAAAIENALAAAWRDGSARWGEDVGRWNYAGMHRLRLDHPLATVPWLGRWFARGPFELPGSATTVLAFGGPWVGEELDVAYGPSMRLVADLADPDRGLAILPGGQSGHPADPHYADQLPLYLRLEMRPLRWSERAIAGSTVSTLRLGPVKGPP